MADLLHLLDGSFQMEGLTFGERGEVLVVDFDPGSASPRVQDVDAASGNHRFFGRDYRSPATWAWTLGINGNNEAHMLEILERLQNAWDAGLALEPGEQTELRYSMAGRTRRIFGRPRNFTPQIDVRRYTGTATVVCDFARADTLHYSDNGSVASTGLQSTTNGGLTAPFPVPFSTLKFVAPQSANLFVNGTAPTWATVRIDAPGGVLNPVVRVADWEVGIIGQLQAGSVVEVDGRPWRRAALLNGKGGALRLSRATAIDRLLLPPGGHQISFSGRDLTGSARASVRWRDASKSL